jgi:hypothetical protein
MLRRNGLSKYDAPLRVQYEWGYQDFFSWGQFINKKKRIKPKVERKLHPNTMQFREWQRGWNAAYFEHLEKLNGPRTRS